MSAKIAQGSSTRIDYLEQCCLQAMQKQSGTQEDDQLESSQHDDAQPKAAVKMVYPSRPSLGTFKKVQFSPEGSLVAASTDSCHLVILQGVSAVSAASQNSEPWSVAVQTAEPLIDFAWCPFMESPEENATLIASCRSNPVYLFEGKTGEKRAGYIYLGDNDVPRTAHALHWDSESMTRIAAGYEASDLALFDVTRPGKVPESRYQCKKLTSASGGKSIIGALDFTPTRGLYAIGSLKGPGTIELMSQTTMTCSGVLDPKKVATSKTMGGGNAGGVVQLQFDDTGNYLFCASRGGVNGTSSSEDGGGDVVVWDLRNLMGGPVHRVRRANNKQQPMYFSLATGAKDDWSGTRQTELYCGYTEQHEASAAVLKMSPWSSMNRRSVQMAADASFANAVSTFVDADGKVFIAASTGSRSFPVSDRFASAPAEVVQKYQGRTNPKWKSQEMVDALRTATTEQQAEENDQASPVTRRSKRNRKEGESPLPTQTATTTRAAPVDLSDSEDDEAAIGSSQSILTGVPTLRVFAE